MGKPNLCWECRRRRKRVRHGLAAAKARGVRIGRERKRNDALIHSLLKAGLSFREIARIARCSHGSVSASKKEYLAKVALEATQVQAAAKFENSQSPVALIEGSVETDALIAAAKNVGEQNNG
jgi:hypothetical protein